MPGEGHPLPLDPGTLRPFGVMRKHIHDILLPAHVHAFGKILPRVGPRTSKEAAVLGRQTQFRDVSHPLFQECCVTARDDPNIIPRIGRQRFQSAQYAIGGNGSIRVFDNRRQCAIVIKHEQSFPRRGVLLNHLCSIQGWCQVALCKGRQVG